MNKFDKEVLLYLLEYECKRKIKQDKKGNLILSNDEKEKLKRWIEYLDLKDETNSQS